MPLYHPDFLNHKRLESRRRYPIDTYWLDLKGGGYRREWVQQDGSLGPKPSWFPGPEEKPVRADKKKKGGKGC